jgi:UDP-glucose 4-epimerase
MSADPPPVVNAGTGTTTSIAEILELMQKLVDRPFTWSSEPAKVRRMDRSVLRADIDRLRAAFPGFRPRSIEAGLGDVLTALGLSGSRI